MAMSFEIKDRKNRILLHMNRKGKLALSRFPDLTEEEISGIAKIYCELDESANAKDIEKFLRFEEENEKFCS
jgi:hypothetical protein